MPQWLFQRLKVESPDITPDFSLRNSSRWLRALRIECDNEAFEDDSLRAFYSRVGRRTPDVSSDNLVFESVLMSLHYLASLEKMVSERENHYSFVRSAIVTWYYGIYYSATAMLAAADGNVKQTHAGNARSWGRQVLDNGLVVGPFAYSLSSLVKKQCESELSSMRAGNTFSLNDLPVDITTARGGCISYLKGTADRERGIVEKTIKRERGFKDLGVQNFRTQVARDYRDIRLAGRTVNFLHQAFRYRGKANYRDAIFLAYGQRQDDWISSLMDGLQDTLRKFIKMASYYCLRRTERGTWNMFISDLVVNSRVDVPEWIVG